MKRPTHIGMQTLTLEVAQDHIDSLSKAKKPILALAELIWNSVDATPLR